MTGASRQRDPEMKAMRKLRGQMAAGALAAAEALLGCVIERRESGWTIRARIVETEAYTHDDPASHSFRGRTARNSPMFEGPGMAYIYTSYGIHRCLNVVTGAEGTGEAVLVRALEPMEGSAEMIRHRCWEGKPVSQLANGPGKLCEALAIGLECNGWDLLTCERLRILPGPLFPGESVVVTPRIGIAKAVEWPRRFLLSGNAFVSRRG